MDSGPLPAIPHGDADHSLEQDVEKSQAWILSDGMFLLIGQSLTL